MATIRKFQFDVSFDAPATTTETPAAPRFTEAQVTAAREEGRAAGLADGRREATAEAEARFVKIAEGIAAAVDGLSQTHAAVAQSARRDVLEVAATICRKAIPALAERGAETEIIRLVEESLATCGDEPRLVVRLAPAQVDAIGARLRAAAGGLDQRLVIIGDDAMPAGDCAVLWPDGGVERSQSRIWTEIDAAIARFLAEPATAAATTP